VHSGPVRGPPERHAWDQPSSGRTLNNSKLGEKRVITLGVILLIIGIVAKVAVLWTLGLVLLLIGCVLLVLGSIGRAVGGRRHYF
jgi:uncharacterized membrane protein HdeD (DUF308 family)